MTNETNRLIENLGNLPATVEQVDYARRGYHLDVRLDADRVRAFATLLRAEGFYLLFVSAVHVRPAIEIVYQLTSFDRPCRIIARAAVAAGGSMPSIADIFDGANWHERETRDMFGVVFDGHPYPEPLLLPEESADLKPLLKAEEAVATSDRIRPAAAPEETGSEKPEEKP